MSRAHPDWSQSGRPTALASEAESAAGSGAALDLTVDARQATKFEASASGAVGGGSATIEYTLPSAGYVRVLVFDIAGRQLASVVDGWQSAGEHVAEFSAGSGRRQVYLYRVDWAGRSVSGKVLWGRRPIKGLR